MQFASSLQRLTRVVLVFGIILWTSSDGFSQISITTINAAYTENFNTLVATSNTQSPNLPNGWALYETGSGANSNYIASVGSTTTNDTYSFGATSGDPERALGTIRGSMSSYIGARFTNNTGSTITQLYISYAGELWRVGTGANTTDKLNFEYSTIATSLNAAVTWTGVPELEFNKSGLDPALLATNGQKNGNTLRKGISQVITNVSIPTGATFWIRWTDQDITDNEDGMAIDDFSLIASTGSFGSTVQTAFTLNETNTMAGIGKTPTQPLDIIGNTRTSGKLFVGSITDEDITNKLSTYTLAVNGTALMTKLVVKKYPTWADYVFDPAYNLPSLDDVEKYIKLNKHLPDVPSTNEVNKEGLDIADNQVMLLRKIEELTLYILQQKKELDEQKSVTDKQQKELKKLNDALSLMLKK